MASTKKMRADELLVARGLCESRSQAKLLIMAGKVRLPNALVDKPGKTLPEDAPIEIVQPPKFVSRGGEKLEGFLNAFSINVTGKHALDVGASTGGFTDCLLQHGATDVTCVDVGRGQLHNKLLQDPRVTNFEKMNARRLDFSTLPRSKYDIIVMDLSFISLKKVLPAVWPGLAPGGTLIALVKPQFEATKEEVDACQGVITDSTIQERVLQEVIDFCKAELTNVTVLGHIDSPIKGGDGNTEFLLGLGIN